MLTAKPETVRNKINEEILKKDKNKVEELLKESEGLMRTRYLIYYIIFVMLNAFCLYYSIIFCIIYRGSSKNWFADGFIGIIIGFSCKLILIFMLTTIRISVRKFEDR